MKRYFQKKQRLALLFLALLTVAFCVDCTGGDPNQPLQEAKRLGYFIDNPNDSIYVVEGIDTVTGEVTPSATLTGDNTLLTNPTAIAVDSRRDILYVADAVQQLILVFAPASTLDGDVTPRRTLIAGLVGGPPGTGGNIQNLYLDEVNNRLYANNVSQQVVQVWDDVSMADDVGPNRFFDLNFFASAMFIDTQRNLGYFGDPIDMFALVYNQPSSQIGEPVPSAVWENDTQPFDTISGITENTSNNILFLANRQQRSIEVFDEASTLPNSDNNNDSENTLEVIPARTLSGDNTLLTTDMSKILFKDNVLYTLISRTQMAQWDSANSVDGDTAPTRVFTIVPEVVDAAAEDGGADGGMVEETQEVILVDFAIDLLH